MKNHRHLSRCMTTLSFDEPLRMAATRLRLSHWNRILCFAKVGPQTMQLSRIGTSSFAIMDTEDQFKGHCHWNQDLLKKAPQPHVPEASVWITRSAGVEWDTLHSRLRPFQLTRKVCHQTRSDLNSRPSLV